MVKRFILGLLIAGGAVLPVAAQDYSTLDVSFGYGNYGVEDFDGTALTTDRVHGFAMHTSINVMSWLGLENFTGAYSLKDDITLITNTFGAKLVARGVMDGRMSPYVAGGFGFGYYTSNRTGGGLGSAAARYALGVDLNVGTGMAIRFDVGGLALGTGLVSGFRTDGWRDNVHVSTGIVFNLGG